MMIKMLIGLLIIACIAPLFIKGPDGEPIMTLDDWKIELPDSVSRLMGQASSGIRSSDPGESASEPMQVYRWQDENGQWHFSNTPPDMVSAEEVEIGEVNVMEAYVPAPQPEPEATAAEMTMPGSPMVSSGQVQQMMETITNLQETVDQRKADLDQAVQP